MWSDNSDSKFSFGFLIIAWETERVSRNVWLSFIRKIRSLRKAKNIKWEKHIFGEREGKVFKRLIKVEILKWNFEILS